MMRVGWRIALLMPIAALTTGCAQASAECIDYGNYLTWVGSVAFTSAAGTVGAIATSGDHAYLVLSEYGLRIVDISSPSVPRTAGSIAWDWEMYGVAVTGGYAFVAEALRGLVVIDVHDPESPMIVGDLDSSSPAYDVAVAAPYAYLASRDTDLQVVNISDATNPRLVNAVEVPGSINSVEIAGSYVVVGSASEGLFIYDISSPENPQLVGTADPGLTIQRLAIAGDLACVLSYQSIVLVDISEVASPRILGRVEIPGIPHDVIIAGAHVYAASDRYGIQAVDISDPEQPRLEGNLNTSGDARCIALAGEYACIVAAAGEQGLPCSLQIIDIRSPLSPESLGTLDTPERPWAIALSGSYAYITGGDDDEFLVVDVSELSHPRIVGSTVLSGFIEGVAIEGDYAFVTDDWTGLHVVDISDPEWPQRIGGIDIPGFVSQIEIMGSHAYIASGAAGLKVVDVSAPLEPRLVGGVATTGDCSDVAIAGDCAYLAECSYGIEAIDISTPAAPMLIGSLEVPGSNPSVAVSGAYAYLTSNGTGPDNASLHVIDIGDPANPRLVAEVDVPMSGSGPGSDAHVKIMGHYAYMNIADWGLQVIDISNPLRPTAAGSKSMWGAWSGIGIDESAVYLLKDYQFNIMPLHCEDTPVMLSRFTLRPETGGVLLHWEQGFFGLPVDYRLEGCKGDETWEVPYETIGAGVFQATDRSAPVREGGIVAYSLFGREMDEDWLLLRQESIRVAAMAADRLGAYPNPFNPATSIRFALSAPGQVRLRVHDTAGRLVAHLTQGLFAAGRHEVAWDGRDLAGHPLSTGIYLCRLDSRDGAASVKLVLLR